MSEPGRFAVESVITHPQALIKIVSTYSYQIKKKLHYYFNNIQRHITYAFCRHIIKVGNQEISSKKEDLIKQSEMAKRCFSSGKVTFWS